jgi:hypothetical protein
MRGESCFSTGRAPGDSCATVGTAMVLATARARVLDLRRCCRSGEIKRQRGMAVGASGTQAYSGGGQILGQAR